jgi:transposase
MKTLISYLGIDVSKSKLHLGTPQKFLGEFENKVAGIEKIVQRITELKPIAVVLEASGGYERLVCEALQDADIPVVVAQPSCVKNFAKSIKVLAKTDKIDAQVIARFGEATKPEPTPKTPQKVREFRALCDRRNQIVDDRVRESNRLETCADPEMRKHIQSQLERLQELEKELDRRIATATVEDAEFQQKSKIMQAVVGVGPKTTFTLLAHFPELGTLSRGQVAALAGLAPHPQESGTWTGKRRIFGGRGAVRKALYMAAKTAARYCPVLKKFYQRLRDAGKAYSVAIIACARKLLIHLNTLLKEDAMKEKMPA